MLLSSAAYPPPMERTIALLLALCVAAGCIGGQGGSATPTAAAPAAATAAPAAPTAAATAAPAAPTAAPAAPVATAEATPTLSPLQVELEQGRAVTLVEARNALRDICSGWMKSSWSQKPSLALSPEAYATRVSPETGTTVFTDAELLAGRKMTECDCRVFLKYLSTVADSEVRADFTRDTDCSAWSHAYGCKILCYGDSEAECRANHGCA